MHLQDTVRWGCIAAVCGRPSKLTLKSSSLLRGEVPVFDWEGEAGNRMRKKMVVVAQERSDGIKANNMASKWGMRVGQKSDRE